LGDDGHHLPSDLAPVYEVLQDMFPPNSVNCNMNEAFSEVVGAGVGGVDDALESEDGDDDCIEETQAEEFATGVLKIFTSPCVGADMDGSPLLTKVIVQYYVFCFV
jgi:hypothetical protein